MYTCIKYHHKTILIIDNQHKRLSNNQDKPLFQGYRIYNVKILVKQFKNAKDTHCHWINC